MKSFDNIKPCIDYVKTLEAIRDMYRDIRKDKSKIYTKSIVSMLFFYVIGKCIKRKAKLDLFVVEDLGNAIGFSTWDVDRRLLLMKKIGLIECNYRECRLLSYGEKVLEYLDRYIKLVHEALRNE